ncbi:MAG: Holliday junction branch migration protein RuvA [Verrucomicrobiota bacterium]
MIAFLEGTVVENFPDRLVVKVGGIGYAVAVPLGTFDDVPAGQAVTVLTHFHVRENEQALYGFRRAEERDLFQLLLNRVSGVGPKLALAILSGMRVEEFKQNVVQNEAAALARISGLGKKTAERIILELKDKLGVAAVWEQTGGTGQGGETAGGDAVLALISLGYKQADAHKAVQKLQQGDSQWSSDELLREALRTLNR